MNKNDYHPRYSGTIMKVDYDDPNEKRVDVLIVGAGISGLTSAYHLLRRDPSIYVCVLESSNSLGGQISSSNLGEMGAKWYTEDQHHIHSLCKSFGLQGKRRMILAPHMKSCRDIDRGIFAFLAKFELKRYINELDLKSELFRPGKSHKCSMKRTIDTMAQHIRRSLFFTTSRQFMMNLVILVSGVSAYNINFVEFMTICHTSNGLKHLIDLWINVPNNLMEISSYDLFGHFMGILQRVEILYNHKVTEIHQYRNQVIVQDANNNRFRAQTIILAIPMDKIESIQFTPELPSEIQRTPLKVDESRYMMTSFLIRYREGYWRNASYSGNFLNHNPFIVGYEYRSTIYSGYMVHEEGVEPLVESIVLHEFARFYGDEMLKPIEYDQRTYPLHAKNHIPFTTPWNRVIWSSSSVVATCYRGHLGGAVQSGLRGAINALLFIRPQLVKWQDLADLQCKESSFDEHSWLRLRISELNVYNVTSTTLVIVISCLLLSRLSKS